MKMKSVVAASTLAMSAVGSYAQSFTSGTFSVLTGGLGFTIGSVLLDATPFAFTTTNFGDSTFEQYTLTASSLAANTHTISVFGIGTAGSGYTGNVVITPAPEPQSYALILAGLGVIGFIGLRRKKND